MQNLCNVSIEQMLRKAFTAGELYGNSYECSDSICDNPYCAIHGKDDSRERAIKLIIKEYIK